MIDINPAVSVVTLNVSSLNAPVKGQRLSNQIKKQGQTICCLLETHFKYKDIYRLKVNGRRKIYHANTNQKKVGVALLISNRAEMDRSSSQKIKKETIEQNSWISFTTIDFSNSRRVSTLLSARGTFSRAGHILNRETHLNTFKRIEPIQWLLSDHNEITLEINNRKSTRNPQICGDYTTHFQITPGPKKKCQEKLLNILN